MSDNQQHPETMCEVFVPAPADLVDVHEIAAAGEPSTLYDAGSADGHATWVDRLIWLDPRSRLGVGGHPL